MNIFPFLHFFVFLVYSCLLVFLLWKDPKSLLNRVCTALLACFAVWSFTLIFIYNPSASKDTARLFDNVGSLGWISFASFFLWFSLIFTEKKKILKRRIIYPLIFILPLLLIYKQWTGFLTKDYIQQSWGWESVWSKSIWAYLFYFHYLSFIVIGLYLILNFRRKIEEPLKKKQAKIIFITALISLVFGTLTDVVFPELNIYTLHLHSLGNVITLIWAFGMVYAIAKYKLMVITPVAAAENIISTMVDSLILLDRQGNIASVNKATLDLSGYGKDELTGKPVAIFFREKDFKNTLLDKAMKKEAIKNYELNFKTKTGDHIPVFFSSSTMMDKAGEMVGIVCIIRDVTESKQAEEKNNWLASFPTLNPTPVLEIDQKKGLVFINTSAKKLFPDLENLQMDHPFIVGTIKYFTELNSSTMTYDNREIEVNSHWYLQSLFLVSPNRLRIYAFDITERKQVEEALRESEERFRLSINATEDGIWEWDIQNNQEFFSPRWCEIIGYSFDDPELPHTYNSWASRIHPDDYDRVISAMNNHLEKGTKYDVDYRHRYKSGEYRWQNSIGQAVFNESGKPIKMVGSIRDITERKQLEQKLEEMATHDFLTGLPNRVLLLDRFTIAVALACRNKSRLAVMSLDLDNFKSINDTLGHDAGDQVLKIISSRLTKIIRTSDTLARVGGDEFILMMLETSRLEDAAAIAQKILDSFTEPLSIDGHQLHLSTSIGIALYPEDAEDLETLTKKADAAMYYSKGHGRNHFKFYGDGDVWITGDHKSAT